jgi:hypothetical protein
MNIAFVPRIIACGREIDSITYHWRHDMTYSPADKKARPVGFILFVVIIGLALLIVGMAMSDGLSTINRSNMARAATVPANCGIDAKTYIELPPEARFQLEADAVCR